MTIVGTCALCRTTAATLLGSHIVPEFFYKCVYTKSHSFPSVPREDDERLAIEQKGYREDLLCASCETKLSIWENKLRQFVIQLTSGSFTTCTASRVDNVTVVSGVDYVGVKMAVLSIFWRMGVAQHKFFAAYELGPYEEKFRVLLDQQDVPPTEEFPILIAKGLLDGEFRPGVLFPVGRCRYGSGLIMQSVVLNGLVIDCLMTNTRRIPEEVLEFSLKQNGHVLVPSRPYEQLGMDLGEFSKRMSGADVKGFYQKHA